MSIRLGPANFPRSNTSKQLQSGKKPGTAKSLYSGITSTQRTQQQQRYFGSASLWRSKRESECPNTVVMKTCDPPTHYHPWESDYSKIITRERKLKPMTKDPYTSMSRLVCHAVEKSITETECYPTLTPAKDVKLQTVNIREAPKPSPSPSHPMTVRYLRRNDLMPSERFSQVSSSEKISLSSQSENKKLDVSFVDTKKTIGVAPTLATTTRLLNRAKMRTDPSVIRRPPRKLIINAAQETIMPLTVYG